MVNDSPNSSWKSTLLGALPFMIWGFALIANEIPHEWIVPEWIQAGGSILFFSVLLLPAVGLAIGWIQAFPRWSYAFMASAVVFSLYLTNASTPGLTFFGLPTFGRELWGWRAWLPLLIGALVAVLISGSLRSVLKLFSNAWEDLTQLTFALFGTMPLLAAIFFDEIDRLYSLYFMVAFALVAVATAIIYLRSAHVRVRIMALAGGIVSTVAILVIGPNLYWQSHGGMNPIPSIVAGIILVLLMMLPSLIQYLRRSDRTLAA